MPPASLSTFAVMMPGPTTARNTASRVFHPQTREASRSVIGPQQADHIVGRDDSRKAAVLVDDRQRQEVVLVEEFRDLILRRVSGATDQLLDGEIGQRRLRTGHDGARERHATDEL